MRGQANLDRSYMIGSIYIALSCLLCTCTQSYVLCTHCIRCHVYSDVRIVADYVQGVQGTGSARCVRLYTHTGSLGAGLIIPLT